ncbi:MAG TPA: YciI family protein [Sphingomonas sp.]|nr:YciI family protein [Sphingomonas sp.]
MAVFLISLTYKKSLEEVDRLLDAHIAWLKQGYAEGLLLASGRKQPRTGGMLIACGARDAVEALLADDPFRREGIADYAITEVSFTMVAPGLEALQG